MKKRPLALTILAFLHFLYPLFDTAQVMYFHHIPMKYLWDMLAILLNPFERLAFFLRFNFSFPDRYEPDFYFLITYIPLIRIISFFISKIYAGIIRYTSTKDAERIFIVNTITSLVFCINKYCDIYL